METIYVVMAIYEDSVGIVKSFYKEEDAKGFVKKSIENEVGKDVWDYSIESTTIE